MLLCEACHGRSLLKMMKPTNVKNNVSQKVSLKSAGSSDSIPIDDVDLEATLSFAKNMMLHPAEFWRRLNPIHNPRFQQAMYPDGIKFGDRFIGTSENSLFFSTLREPQRADVIMASPRGLTRR